MKAGGESSEDEFSEMLDDPEMKKVMMMQQREFMADLMAEQAKMKKKVLNTQPGQYREIAQDQFLPSVTKNDNCVVHFFHNDFERCKIID